jgi:hypothetical protein
MKQKLILYTALFLLLVLAGFMVKDFFFSKTNSDNPYPLDMKAIRSGDTLQPAYTETIQMKPELTEIHGLAVDGAGTVYVAGKDSVQIFSKTGVPEGIFRIPGTARCIALGEKGSLYLGMGDHLEIVDHSGNRKAIWKSFGANAVVTSIAIKGNDVFVADAGERVVYHCDGGGKLLNRIGLKDPATGVPGFIIPSPYFDLGISRDGFLWVVNPGRHSFEKYTFAGQLITTWGKATLSMEGFCGCCNPSHFAFLSDSLFVTSEKAIERVKVYNPDGSFRSVVATPGSFEEGTVGLDLAVDPQNRILVLDPVKNLIRIFEPK